MRRAFNGLVLLGLVFVLGAIATAQPPEGKKGDKGPKGFQLGKVLPPFIVDELELTEEQEAKIAALEKEVKAKLEKILTAKQKRIIQNARPPRKGKDDNVRADKPAGGIQWFATLESARAEAKRTGRPILLVSAAPHCSGVSGIW